jgi:hypothetical protein
MTIAVLRNQGRPVQARSRMLLPKMLAIAMSPNPAKNKKISGE